MKRILFVLALAAAGCSSGPDEEELVLGLFNRLELDLDRYNSALERGDQVEQARVAYEIRTLVERNFDRVANGLKTEEQDLQSTAVFALGFSRNPAAVAPLVEASESSEVGLRVNAIAALGVLGIPDVPIEPFRARLKDEASDVRVAALYGLRQLLRKGEDRGMIEGVHGALSDESPDVVNEALIVLRKIGRPESVEPILTGPIRAKDVLLRSNAAVTLGTLGPAARRANPFLIEMLLDTESKIVESAWVALNKINEKDFDRSYATWRDWYDDEQRHFYSCPTHRQVEEKLPGECSFCKTPLERFAKDSYKKPPPRIVLYGCPDHREVVTSTPSTCGKAGCGKRLVERAPDPRVYTCPDHAEVQTTTPARCGKLGCGKDLVPRKSEKKKSEKK